MSFSIFSDVLSSHNCEGNVTPAQGPPETVTSSSTRDTAVRFVMPGLAGLAVPAISPTLLTTLDDVEKDIELYEHKATLHMLHVATRAAEMTQETSEGVANQERVKVLPVQCPLAFWFSQVMLAVSSREPRKLRF